MERGDKLYPSAIKAQCDEAIGILEQNNLDIENLQNRLQDFIVDDELVSEAYSALKLQISDYFSLTSAMISANDLDIEDMNILKKSVGSEDLIGDVIITNKETAYKEMEEYEELASEYYSKALVTFLIGSISSMYFSRATYYSTLAECAKVRYMIWVAKEEKFDKINASTQGLFSQSEGLRNATSQGIASIVKSFQNGKYVIDMNAPWRAALSTENDKLLEQVKAGLMKEDKSGELVYDWDKIEELLKKETNEVSDLEYLALVDMMSEMTNEELEELFSIGQINVSVFDNRFADLSNVLRIATERYLYITQIEAELTIFDENSKYFYDEKAVTNELSKAFFVYEVMECITKNGGGYRHSVFITSEEENGIITYVADVPLSINLGGNLGDAYAAHSDRREIKVSAWGSNELLRRELDEYEKVAFISLDSEMGDSLGKAGLDNTVGYIFNKIGEMTIEEVGSSLSHMMTVANIMADIQENYANSVVIKGGIESIDMREQVEALGIKAGVMNVKGLGENYVQLICPKYDPEELMVRVEVYNSTQLMKTNGTTITVEELKHAFENGGGEVLDHYVDWYYTEDGGEDSRKYWDVLEKILNDYREQNPGINNSVVRELNIAQLQELINKKNNPAYEINMQVMKGEE